MKINSYKELFTLEDTYWWFIGKRLIVDKLLEHFFYKKKDCKILDAGCGTGENLRYFQKYGTITGIDKSINALKYCEKRKNKRLVCAEAQSLPFKNHNFQIIFALDLIEHLKSTEETDTLKELYRVLLPDGILITTVPALPLLWSAHDKALGHLKRYTYRMLKQNFTKQGFKINKLSYFCLFTLPITLISRFIKKSNVTTPKTDFPRVPLFINKLLIILMKLEAVLLKRINFPIGSSIILCSKK